MPYIPQEKRAELDPIIEQLVTRLLEIDSNDGDNDMEGNINYTITKVLMSLYPARYRYINQAMGVLACVQQEFYRVVAGPYEDQKKFENGEVEIVPLNTTNDSSY